MNIDGKQIAATITATLEQAWNAGDGEGFGRPFTADADFIDIRGDHHQTRDVIAKGHQAIFDTVFKGSVLHYNVVGARTVASGAVVAQVRGALSVPGGPMAGQYNAIATLVLVQTGNDWQIAAFHNMLIAQKR